MVDSLVSQAMVQAHWCVRGDAVCLLKWHFYIAACVIGDGFLIDLFAFNFYVLQEAYSRIFARPVPPSSTTKAKKEPKESIWAHYEVKTTEILDSPFLARETLYKKAGILVENVGDGDVRCVAKLTKIEKIKVQHKNIVTVPVKVSEVNPRGYYLRWDDGKNGCVVTKFRPRTIEIADAYDDRAFYRHGHLLFEQAYKTPLEDGHYYFVSIDIFRVSDNNHVRIKTFEMVLGMLYSEKGTHVKWLHKDDIQKTR
jgi:hypothetical protein